MSDVICYVKSSINPQFLTNFYRLARILLRVFPEQAIDIMEGEEYLGASALHLAIAYSNNELVIDLVEAGANINQRAIGRFFLPKDQQSNKPKKNTDYEGLAYLGEYPLAWAACCSNESVYNLLLEHGADPDARDHFGNMILHMVVVCDKLVRFGNFEGNSTYIKIFLGYVRLCPASSKVSVQQWHRKLCWIDSTYFSLHAWTCRSLQRNVRTFR